jgi:threonylcarbamoyladenosine tRNA methylthiotransferase MtaB
VTSRPIEDVLEECRRLIDTGHREIVLCGVFLGAFGRSTAIRRRWGNERAPLVELLERIAELPGLWRVRLSSLEPGDLSDELLSAAEHPRVAKHFHLPLQSGSEAILRRMNRQYTAAAYLKGVARLRERLDRPAVTTDVIVGFPGETEEDFARTLDAAQQAGFAKIHAFPFSALEPTAAWHRRREAPPSRIVRRRMAELGEVETRTAEAFRRDLLGERLEALVESTRPGPGLRQAMTGRYQTVVFEDGPGIAPGDVVEVDIEAVQESGLRGRVVQPARET